MSKKDINPRFLEGVSIGLSIILLIVGLMVLVSDDEPAGYFVTKAPVAGDSNAPIKTVETSIPTGEKKNG